jgi:hypothetical protein
LCIDGPVEAVTSRVIAATRSSGEGAQVRVQANVLNPADP